MGIVITSLTVFISFLSNLAAAAVTLELIYQASTFQDVVQSSNLCFSFVSDPLVEIHVREQVNKNLSYGQGMIILSCFFNMALTSVSSKHLLSGRF